MARQRNETAFVIDEERIAVSGDGAYLVGLPGLWRPNEPVHPEALGMSVSDFRDVVAALDLPVKEVKVAEDEALRAFAPADGKLPSEPVSPGGRALVETEIVGPTIGDEVQVTNTLLDAADATDEERAEAFE